jgi:hypothetical protein
VLLPPRQRVPGVGVHRRRSRDSGRLARQARRGLKPAAGDKRPAGDSPLCAVRAGSNAVRAVTGAVLRVWLVLRACPMIGRVKA